MLTPYLENEVKTNGSQSLDFRFWMEILRMTSALQKVRQKELRKLGVTVMEASIIFEVGQSVNSISPSGVSKNLIQEAHAVSQLLVKMENQGLLRRNKDLPRRNMIRLELTDQGKNILQESKKIKSIFPILAALTDKEKERLIKDFEKLREKATHNSK